MFEVVEGSPRTMWVPMDTTSTPTLYVGQLVKITGDGAGAFAVAAGALDVTNKQVLFGVVIGTNNLNPVWDATYQTESITAVITQAAQNARQYFGVEGKHHKGDQQAFVKVAVITAETVLKGSIFAHASNLTPLTTLTVTTGSTTGLGFTSNACDFTPVADVCTSYCRTGANAGIYRISDDTSTTVETNDVAFPWDIAIGDTFVRAPFKPVGLSYPQLSTLAMWFNATATPATDYMGVNVLALDLRESGKEHVIFQFSSVHMLAER